MNKKIKLTQFQADALNALAKLLEARKQSKKVSKDVKGTYKLFINGLEARKDFGMRLKQFKFAENASYKRDSQCFLTVINEGKDVHFYATNYRLEAKWIGDK